MKENNNKQNQAVSLSAQGSQLKAEPLSESVEPVLPVENKKNSIFKKFLFWFLSVFIFLVILFFSFPHIMGLVAGGDIKLPDDSDLQLYQVKVPEAENLYFDLIKLADLINVPDGVEDIKYLESMNWDDKLVEDLIKKNQKMLQVFSEASSKSIYQNVNTADPSNIKSTMPIIPMNNWRQASRVSGIKALHLMKQGQDQEAFVEAMKPLQIGYTIEKADNNLMIAYLVGLAMKKNATDVLKILIDKTSLSPEQLKEIQNSVNQYKPITNVSMLKSEYVIFKEANNSMFSEVKRDFGMLEPPLNGFYFKPNQTISQRADFVRDQIKFYESDCATKPIVSDGFIPVLWKMYFTENIIGKMMLSMSNMAMNNVKIKKCERDVELKNVELSLAIKRYLFVKGEYPESVLELVPEFILQIPQDFFSGQEINFDPERKIVYSIGRNWVAEGGDSEKEELVASFDFSVTEARDQKRQELVLLDSDDDGLNDQEEINYGTDMYNPDTDNDGYTDKDEIVAGYNPLGLGKLKEIANKVPEKSLTDMEKELKIEYLLLGEHNMYDLCYDHDTDSCIKFFDQAVKQNLMTHSERFLSTEEDPENIGHTYHPNFSDVALSTRRDVLNRYFDSIRNTEDNLDILLDKIKCSSSRCQATAVLNKEDFDVFIK